MKRLFFSSLNGLGTFVENQLSVVYDFISELSILCEMIFFLLILYLLISTDIGQLLLLLIIVSWFVNNAHFSFPFFFVGDVGMEYGDKYL